MFKKCVFLTLTLLSTVNPMEEPTWSQRLSGMAPTFAEVNPTPVYIDPSRLTDEEVTQALAQCPAEILDIFHCYTENQKGAITNGLSNKFPNVLMFDGPPGTGKSTLARAFAQAAEVPFTFVCCAALSNEYKHSGRTNVIETFKRILERRAAHVLIMDEIQSVLYRQENNVLNPEVAEAVWAQLDTCCKRKELMVILTGNDYELLPPQLKSRINRFSFKLPTLEERKSLIQFILNSEYPNCHNFTQKAINQIAKKTAYFSIRDIERMLARSASNCRIRVRNSALPQEINIEDVQKAIKVIKQDERFAPWYKSLGATLQPALVPALQIGIPLVSNMVFQAILHRQGLAQAREFHNAGLIQQSDFHKANLIMQAALAYLNLENSKNLQEQSLAHSQALHQQSLTQTQALHQESLTQTQSLQAQSSTQSEAAASTQKEVQAIQVGISIAGLVWSILTGSK